MLIFKAMAFSSCGHNIFNNQYKMATIIHDREGVGRGPGCLWLAAPAAARGGAGRLLGRRAAPRGPPPLVHTPRPAHGRPAAPRGGPEGAGHFPACDAQARPRLLRQGARRRRGLSAGQRGVGQRFRPGRGLRAARLGCARLTPPRTGAHSRPSALGPRTATRLLTLEAGNTPKTSFRLRRPLCLPTTRLH